MYLLIICFKYIQNGRYIQFKDVGPCFEVSGCSVLRIY